MSIIKSIKIRAKRKFITKEQKREDEKQRKMPDSSPVLLILYLLGLLGLMLPFSGFFAADYQFLFYLLVAAVDVLSAALWYIYIHKNKLFMPIVIGFCALSVLLILPMWGNLSQAFSVYSYSGSTAGFANSGAEVLLFPIFIGMAVLVLFSMEFVLRSHTVLFLIAAAIVIFGPLINIKPDLFSIILIIIFQFGFYVLNMTDTRQGNRFRAKNRAKTASASVLTTAAVLLLSFIPAVIAQNIFEDELYSSVYQADGYIQDFMNEMTGSLEGSVINGNISRGNLRQTGEKMFEAETGEIPLEKLYLVGFNGGEYLGDSWDNAYYPIYEDTDMDYYDPDTEKLMSFTYPMFYYREPFINEVINQVNDEYYDELSGFLKKETGIKVKEFYRIEANDTITGYDVRGRQFQIYTSEEETNTIRLYDSDTITDEENKADGLSDKDTNYWHNTGDTPSYWVYFIDLGKFKHRPTIFSNMNYSDLLTPIYSAFGVRDDDTSLAQKSNTLYIKPTGSQIHTALMPYYSGQKFRGTIGTIDDETTEPYYNTYRYQSAIDMSGQWQNYPFYEKFVDSYIEKTEEYYTDYPADELPRLTQLCAENDLEGVNEVTTFILYTLQTRTRYSTTPGTVPFNKNIVEHFLFDNRRGFCVHYATTAALMYRMYGIPARYVTGYALTPDMFTRNNSTESSAKSTTLSYHADVTDHYAHAWVEIFLKDYGWVPVDVTPTAEGDMNASFPGYDEEEMNRIMQEHDWHFRDTSSDSTNNNNNTDAGDDTEIDYLQLLTVFMLSAFILTFVIVLLRWIIITHKQHTMGCRRSFDRLITLLHFSGLLTEFNGSEKDFAHKLFETVDSISSEEAAKLIGILETDNYSETNASDSDSEFVRSIYFKTVTECYAKTPWYKKPLFRFIKCFQ